MDHTNGIAPRIGRVLPLLVVTGFLAACGGGGSGGDGGGGSGPTNFVVTALAVGSGNISPSTATVSRGASATFSVAPTAGSSIASVSGCGGTLTGSSYTTGPISSSCTVTATFSAGSYQVTASAGPGGNISPATQTVQQGNTASFSLVPNTGYGIGTVTGCGGTLNGSTYTTGPISSNCTISAVFSLSSYQVSATAGQGGSISPGSQTVPHGATTSFTLAPQTGYRINSVAGCGGVLNDTTYTTGPVTGACTITAAFGPSSFTIYAVAGAGGSISPAIANVPFGDVATFLITPEDGYFATAVEGCNGQIKGGSYITGQITNDCSISASFIYIVDLDDPIILIYDTGSSSNPAISLSFGGTTDALIDWGDLSSEEIRGINSASAAHAYEEPGVYTVTISGLVTNFPILASNFRGGLLEVESFGSTGLKSLNSAFAGTFNIEVPSVIPPTVTDLSETFAGTFSFAQDISSWDVSNVTNMSGMFRRAWNLSYPLGLDNWDVSSVTDMSAMFSEARSFNEPIGNWDVSSVTDMTEMFWDAWDFNQPINAWDVSSVSSMREMLADARSFNQPLGQWDVSSVADMRGMFRNAWRFNQSIGNWDVSSVTDMLAMFWNATDFNQPIGNWDVGNVTSLDAMFWGARSFNQPIGPWDVSGLTSMRFLFFGASNFNQPIANWDVSRVTDMDSTFSDAASFDQPIGTWDVGSVTNMMGMFFGADSFDQPIGNWNVRNVTNMGWMFRNARNFNQPIGQWDVSDVESMGRMFEGATNFNQDLSPWCVVQISSPPSAFDMGATSWMLPRPNWGAPCSSAAEALAYLVSQTPRGGTITLQPGAYQLGSFVVERDLTIAAATGEGRVTLEYVGFDETFISVTGAGTQLTLEGVDLRTQRQDMLAFITDNGIGEDGTLAARDVTVRLVDVTMYAPGGHAIYSEAPGATYLIEGGAYLTGRTSFVVIDGAELNISPHRDEGTVVHAGAFQPAIDRPHGVLAADLQLLTIDRVHFTTDGPHVALVGDLAWGLLRDNDYERDKAAVVLLDSRGNLLEDLSGRIPEAGFAIDSGELTVVEFESATAIPPNLWRTVPRGATPLGN